LALGTISPSGQKRFRRPDVKGAFEEVLHHARSHGMNAVAYIIVGAPGQDPGDSVSDLLYLAGKPALVGVSVYYPSPGSVDYGKCGEAGILPERFSLMRATALPVSHTTTREESVTLLRLGRIVNYVKSLVDAGETVPEGRPFKEADLRDVVDVVDVKDRRDAGKVLLGCFLNDGKIRGVTPDGEVFEHKVSESLTRRFLAGLAKTRILGWIK
jgi:hypothetical protein